MSGKLIKKWNSMTELLDHNLTYRKGAIYHHLRGKSIKTYGYKWTCDPPIIKIKVKNKDIFKPILNYKNYDFSNYGVSKKGLVINYSKNIIKKNQRCKDGYEHTLLFCKNIKIGIMCSIHKLVAHVYVANDNPRIKTQVNHIDKNRSNNYYKNLEWITPQDNAIHAVGKMVKMIDVDTNKVIKIFKCVKDADRYFEKKL
ncbi:HNH endonuclease [Tupanvirus soda lake]|uniref:HNH endonuclease n=2 Tax=Tupanvirus TaxID=2094720 RepID=A0A6N1P0H3_9VIRU|nr:HNH endonuclease [Tupanvirus soda lake]QKU34761.1 HNH endonuclease [Tupanvirus soda lake]